MGAKVVYKDKSFTFENLLEKEKGSMVNVQVWNQQILVTEIIRVKNGIAPGIISGMLKLSNSTFNLRNKRNFVSGYVKTMNFGTESLSHLYPKLWDLLLKD